MYSSCVVASSSKNSLKNSSKLNTRAYLLSCCCCFLEDLSFKRNGYVQHEILHRSGKKETQKWYFFGEYSSKNFHSTDKQLQQTVRKQFFFLLLSFAIIFSHTLSLSSMYISHLCLTFTIK